MKSVTVATFMLAATLSGCIGFGNWSDDDILFAKRIPDRSLVTLKVPGAEDVQSFTQSALSQGLNDSCANANDEKAITCVTREIAKMFNRLTFTLLDIVEFITHQRPSRRESGRRVWGPYYMGHKDQTVRFEMRRDDGIGEGGMRYCLHVAKGRKTGLFVGNSVSCGRDREGFIEIFSGTFVPGDASDDSRPKEGTGTMVLDLNKQRDNGLNRDDPNAQGRFDFTYDTTDGKQVINIRLSGITNQETGLPGGTADYEYFRDVDGKGRMDLDLVGVDNLDSIGLLARWNSEGASRVDATGTDGTTTVRGWECANAERTIVSRSLQWMPEEPLTPVPADESLCPNPLSLLPSDP